MPKNRQQGLSLTGVQLVTLLVTTPTPQTKHLRDVAAHFPSTRRAVWVNYPVFYMGQRGRDMQAASRQTELEVSAQEGEKGFHLGLLGSMK